jgi:ubiquinone/menaquinone biosynthesis C-methylase UbiE
MGELVIEVAAPEAYRLWSTAYDDTSNPLLALETRVLRPRLNPMAGRRMIDVATGTGRWAVYARSQGAQVMGADLSPAMLRVATRKPSLSGRLTVADMRNLPFSDWSADLAICSFALGYVDSIRLAIAELARVARRVIVTDIHPIAVASGWARSFRIDGQVYRIENYAHSLAAIEQAAVSAGLEKRWELESPFGAPEWHFFKAAGKEEPRIPALYAKCWSRK